MEFPRPGDKSAYPYGTLRNTQIRRLRLIPGRKDTELLASLEVVPLPTKSQQREQPPIRVPKYEALSYYWGEKSPPGHDHFIKILEANQSYEIRLRPNLEAAFRILRHESDERYLWVDAICIDQSSKDEKNVQIPRMHEIYNKAEKVCVWLGPEADKSDDAMSFVDTMLDLDLFNRFLGNSNDVQVDLLACFAKLLMRPWFNRRWIVQELAVARDARVYCGTVEVSWTRFAGAVSLFSSKHVPLKEIFRSSAAFHHSYDYLGEMKQSPALLLVHAASNFFRKSDDGEILERLQSLEDIVSTLATFDASDPRDVIYAVVSLSNDAKPRTKNKDDYTYSDQKFEETFNDMSAGDSPVSSTKSVGSRRPSAVEDAATDMGGSGLLRPDDRVPRWKVMRAVSKGVNTFLSPFTRDTIQVKYDSSVFEVYKSFLELAISKSGSLDILCRPWADSDPNETLPSWIPAKSFATHSLRNGRAYTRVRADLLVGSPRDGGKRYSASKDSKAVWVYRSPELLERSLVVKGFILDTVGQKEWPAIGGSVPGGWFNAYKSLSKKKRFPDALWRTLVADRGLEGQKPPPAYYELACNYIHGRRNHMGGLDTRDVLEEDCPEIVKEFLQRMNSVVFLRRLIVSGKNRLLGLVPPETKKRDKICILDGCSVPVILREIPVTIPSKSKPVPVVDESPTAGGVVNRGENLALTSSTSSVNYTGGQFGVAIGGITNQTTETIIPTNRHLGPAPLPPGARQRRPSIVLQSPSMNSTTPPIEEVIQSGSEAASPSDHSIPPSPSSAPIGPPQPDGEIPPTAPPPALPQLGEQDNMHTSFTSSRKPSWERPKFYYKFIGECYIHGMMEGEAMKLSSMRQDFWLR